MAGDRVRLSCTSGSFTALLSEESVQVVYTDYGGTSRTSVCKPVDMLVFAMSIIDFYSTQGASALRAGGD